VSAPAPGGDPDWFGWHRPYDDPGSPLAERLAAVQGLIRSVLDQSAAGPIRVVSICAGQGRDLIGALAGHPRRPDVSARLVELDARNVEAARSAATAAGLGALEVAAGDASLTDSYAGAVPADLVLACGVFGNVSLADVERTVAHLPMLCAPGAAVIWTRHRRPPDATPAIRAMFARHGFAEVSFVAPEGRVFGVGAERLRAEPMALVPGIRLFTFTGDGSRPA
jgi:Putative methyltransferase